MIDEESEYVENEVKSTARRSDMDHYPYGDSSEEEKDENPTDTASKLSRCIEAQA